jgi:catechol 2,3-dioxygenase-like lactoylglutathione lyase family enzyme
MITSTSLRFSSFVLFVSDIHRSKDFYINVLGEEIATDFGTNVSFKTGLAIWQIKQDQIIVKILGEKAKPGSAVNSELYYETEDIDSAFKLVKNHDTEFLHELHEESWGQRTFRFFDPDGYLIEISESMSGFVKRMSKGGKTSEEISDKTGIPDSMVEELLTQ